MYGARLGVAALVAGAEWHVLIESEELFLRMICTLSKDLVRWMVAVGVTAGLRTGFASDFPSKDLVVDITAELFASFTLEPRGSPSEDFDLFMEKSLAGDFLSAENAVVALGVVDEGTGENALEAVPPNDCGLLLGEGATGDVKDAGDRAARFRLTAGTGLLLEP